ncbi:MAG: sigma-70 family RNA polymerase sigma factor [Flavobacterium sp.]|nr:sigma-70 family RNA polymerase sigma factor [Flavobacterium sp.]
MALTNSPDSVLVQNYVAGDEAALLELINRHQSKIYGFIYSKLDNRHFADDIFQETFLKVIRTLKSNSYNEEGKFLPWVMRIAHNLIMDEYRKVKKQSLLYDKTDYSIFSIIKDNSLNIEDKMVDEMIFQDVQKIILELPEDQKEILMMRYYQKLNYNEIAELTGLGVNTAIGKMRYAILNLRKIVKKNKISLTA